MSDDKESIKKRILALMAKTTANGCSEEEAMAASQKVAELLNKYQMSLSDIKLREEANCRKGQYDTGLKSHPAVFWCLNAIGKYTDCKVWFDLYGGADGKIAYKFFGLDHDVIVAEYITKICDWAIIYGGEDFKDHDAYRLTPKQKRSKVLEEFRIAMAYRLAKRLRDMKDAMDQKNRSDGRSLVVLKGQIVTEEWAKLNLHLGKAKKSKGKTFTSQAAYDAGTAAGDRVQLNPGVADKGHSPKEYLS